MRGVAALSRPAGSPQSVPTLGHMLLTRFDGCRFAGIGFFCPSIPRIWVGWAILREEVRCDWSLARLTGRPEPREPLSER
jgi:hypothetical protein